MEPVITLISRSNGDLGQDPDRSEVWSTYEGSLDDFDNKENQRFSLGSVLKEVNTSPFKNINTPKLEEVKVYYQPKLSIVLSPKEMISLVQNNSHLMNALAYPKQDMSKGAEETYDKELNIIINRNYRRTSEGALEMWNQDILRRQKMVLGSLIKQFGSAMFSGKSIMNISLPVVIFETRSQIEREANNFLYAPYFLEKAGKTMDKLEQFKLTVSYFVSSLHLGTNPQKPFNPVLGETFQGIIGGCPVYGEQVSHHPPTLALQMLGKNFTIDGVIEFTASISLNSVKSKKVGCLKVGFKNTNSTIRAQYPAGFMNGTAMGKRTFQFTDKFYIFDVENRLYAEIDFELEHSSARKRAKSLKAGKDFFVGTIWRINEKFAEKLASATKRFQDIEFKEKHHAVQKLDTIEGAWLEYLKIGEQTYWTYGRQTPSKLQYFDNPLPSDSNYRLDLLYLKAGDEEKAQEHKVLIETLQRKDKKLRDQRRR